MTDEPKHPLQQLLEHLMGDQRRVDYSKWVQIATLTPEEITKHRGILQNGFLANQELELLQAKAKRIAAQLDEAREEWWNSLYKSHALPQGDYHITEDFRILARPKKRKEN